jgi:pyrroloquinoline-quinone synthase
MTDATLAPSLAPRITAAARAVLQRITLMNNPYLQTLRNGEMSLDQFRASQQQFFYAVRYFPRPMAALLMRVPDPGSRLDILHNVVEEHGDFHENQFHQNTFAAFLNSIGVQRPDTSGVAMRPAVHAFNNTLMAACLADEIETGIACLGVIEFAFAGLSAEIGQAVVARKWVPQNQLIHYALHAELDIRHADEFFAIIEGKWDNPDAKRLIEQGLELGAYSFDQLYRNL